MASPLIQDLLDWLNACWTPFHVVEEAKRRLRAAGFTEVSEKDAFEGQIKAAGKYFVTRNMTSIVAFVIGSLFKAGKGFTVVGAHTDSPCPKLKPVCKNTKSGCLIVSTQTYGGGLWHTWFDRDLGIAGRVIVKRGEGKYSHELVQISRPICRIPTLAIHLTKGDERSSFNPNMQNNFDAVLATEIKAKLLGDSTPAAGAEGSSGANARLHPILLQLLAKEIKCEPEDIEDLELQLCDTQPSVVAGAMDEFIYSGRLDNLCSSWQSLRALIDSSEGEDSLASADDCRVAALFDHEEVGSDSAVGAGGTLLPQVMRRVTGAFAKGSTNVEEDHCRALRRSYVVSADMAHAVHPNYSDRHDPDHAIKMHKGLAIKHNANQRYATTSLTAFLFREVGKRAGLSTQEFCVKQDMGCGSTIGPILATLCGVRTVDIGAPMWSMHSCREMMGTSDAETGYKHLKAVYETFSIVDKELSGV